MVEQHRHNTARDTQRSLRMLDFLLGAAWREGRAHEGPAKNRASLIEEKKNDVKLKAATGAGFRTLVVTCLQQIRRIDFAFERLQRKVQSVKTANFAAHTKVQSRAARVPSRAPAWAFSNLVISQDALDT